MDKLHQEIQNMVQQFNQLGQQFQHIAQVQKQQQLPPPAAHTYALSPAQVNADQFINYDSTDGKKLFKAITEELGLEFDVEAKNINLFCKELGDRAQIAGWNTGQGNIIAILDLNGTNRYLLTE